MIRARFKANYEDSRPVKFPPPLPYWETGFAADESYAIVVAYFNNEGEIHDYWPEAEDIDIQYVDEIVYTDRFRKPDWYSAP